MMPSVLIEVRRPLGERAGADIIEAVHVALREAFKIPASDRCVRLVVHEPHRFECPPDRVSPELYTHVSLDVSQAGRWKPSDPSTEGSLRTWSPSGSPVIT